MCFRGHICYRTDDILHIRWHSPGLHYRLFHCYSTDVSSTFDKRLSILRDEIPVKGCPHHGDMHWHVSNCKQFSADKIICSCTHYISKSIISILFFIHLALISHFPSCIFKFKTCFYIHTCIFLFPVMHCRFEVKLLS